MTTSCGSTSPPEMGPLVEGFAVFDQNPRQGCPGTFFFSPALTLTIGCEFLAVRVTVHFWSWLNPATAQAGDSASPRRVLAGLGREDRDDVGDFASIERRVDVPF